MRRDLLGRRSQDIEPGVERDGLKRPRARGRGAPFGRRMAAALHHGGASFGDGPRGSTEVMDRRAGPQPHAARAVPWLGLLLWMFACAALFVSLVMRGDDLHGERRVARSAVEETLLERAQPVPGLTRHASGYNLFTERNPSSN